METRTSFLFAPFRLDVSNEQLWREEAAIPLRPKTFAVLRYLVEHPGQLVTKDELLDAVWAGTVVSDTVLKSCIRELREALGDEVQTPRFIATVHRRGYRWIAANAAPVPSSKFRVPSGETQDSALRTQHSVLVGRESELTHLHSWLAKALHGERQLIFVTGEPGIGKTTLIDAFLQTLDARPSTLNGDLWLGRGQCIEQYGTGEPYMPILEALGRLCREPGGDQLIALLHQHAPTWLVQMPTLLNVTELEALQHKVPGATRERMLREMGEAVAAITADRPFVLWLEDLHWSDPSTLELLSLLARQREPARLLVLGTYRPVDVIVSEHPLRVVKQELQLHGQCQELAVRLLTEDAVAEYLTVRVEVDGGARRAVPLQHLAHTIHERTEGNPLFMVHVVNEFLAQEKWDAAALEVRTPTNIRQMIEQQLERLSAEDRHIIEVASVAGMEFSSATVAAGTEAAVDEVEQRCAALARRGQFLQTKGMEDWPDGTVATRYGFLHALYQEGTYERVPAGRRITLHQRIGERTEAAYGAQASEIATELAVHFERGRDYQRAVQYLHQAGQNAARRSAHQEAISLLTKGLELLKTLPDTPERAQHELRLQATLGPTLTVLKGYAAPEVERAYAQARELCQQVGDTPQLFPVLNGLWGFHFLRAELQTARELAEQIFRLARSIQDPALLLWPHGALGLVLFHLGELTSARAHLEQGMTLYDPQLHRPHGSQVAAQDPKVTCLCYTSWTLWHLGYPDQARQRSAEALSLAQGLSHPFSLAFAFHSAAWLDLLLRDVQTLQERTKALLELAREQSFPFWLALGALRQGWVLTEQGQEKEGIVQMNQSMAAGQATGSALSRSWGLALLANAYGKAGQIEEGLSVVTEALTIVDKTGERCNETELYRLKGELTLQQSNTSSRQVTGKSKASRSKSAVTNSQPATPNPQKEAEACFFNAIEIARRQSAKSWELRASTSLARLWQQQGKQKEAHKLLTEIYGWFTEGFDTKDLQEAKALLGELR